MFLSMIQSYHSVLMANLKGVKVDFIASIKLNVNNRTGLHHPPQRFHHFHTQLRSISFHIQFLNHNFDVVRQCLLRIKDLETNMGQSTENATNLQGRITKI
jgi:hypothetical protein